MSKEQSGASPAGAPVHIQSMVACKPNPGAAPMGH